MTFNSDNSNIRTLISAAMCHLKFLIVLSNFFLDSVHIYDLTTLDTYILRAKV